MFDKIQKEVSEGLILYTPVDRKEFEIKSVKPDKVVFSVGVKPTLIPIPRAILDDIPNFLRNGDWVMIGSRHDVAPKYSLQDFIDHHPSRSTQHSSDSNYVASLLEHLKIADVTHKRTSKIRLRSDWLSTEK